MIRKYSHLSTKDLIEFVKKHCGIKKKGERFEDFMISLHEDHREEGASLKRRLWEIS